MTLRNVLERYMAVDKKTHGKIIQALRRMSFSHSGRNEASARQKRGPATFECEQCGTFVYTGARKLADLDFIEGLKVAYPNLKIIKGKVIYDHIIPVVPVEGFPNSIWDWNIYIDNMFVGVDGWQVLCEECNIYKTADENKDRQKVRKKKKVDKAKK